jgi:hypothetical protein
MASPVNTVDLFVVGSDFYSGSTRTSLRNGWCSFGELGQTPSRDFFGNSRELGTIYYFATRVAPGALNSFDEHERQRMWLGRQGANVARIIVDAAGQKTRQHIAPTPGSEFRYKTEREAVSSLGNTTLAPEAMVISADRKHSTPLLSFLKERYDTQLITLIPPDFTTWDSGSGDLVQLLPSDLKEARLRDDPNAGQIPWDTYNQSRSRGVLAGRWFDKAFPDLVPILGSLLDKGLAGVKCQEAMRWLSSAHKDAEIVNRVRRRVAHFLNSDSILRDDRVLAHENHCIEFIAKKLIKTIASELIAQRYPQSSFPTSDSEQGETQNLRPLPKRREDPEKVVGGGEHGHYEFSPAAERRRARLDRVVQVRIDAALAHYATTGHGDVKPLESRPGERRLRVGKWRVFFCHEPLDFIRVLGIDNRGEAY